MTYEIEEKDILEYLASLDINEMVTLIEKCFHNYPSQIYFAEGLLNNCPKEYLQIYRKIKE